MSNYRFEGWLGLGPESSEGKMVWQSFDPKRWEEPDVETKITHCGVCASDVYTLRSGWFPTDYPCCTGHEIVGVAVRVGSKVTGIQLGDRIGIGAQCDSCQQRFGPCEECSQGKDNYCPHKSVQTYNSTHINGDKAYGGYAKHWRGPAHMAFKIPDNLSSAEAALMLCGGITTYTLLKEYGCGPGKSVGIIGIGGLGHFGVLWAQALGADKIVAISRGSNKMNDALKLGANQYITTSEDGDWAKNNAYSLDVIVCTVSLADMPLDQCLMLLKTGGMFVQLGGPEAEGILVQPFSLLMKGAKIAGSAVGSPDQIREMPQFAVERGIHPWIQQRPMYDANTAVVDMENGLARHRVVLFNEE